MSIRYDQKASAMALACFFMALALAVLGFGVWAAENAMDGAWVWIATGVVAIWPVIEIWKLR